MNPNDSIPVSMMLQVKLPSDYKSGVPKVVKDILDKKKDTSDYKYYFSLRRLKELRINKYPKGSRDRTIMRFKVNEKYRPYIQTSAGILLYT
jgi:hypothetical protein